MGAKHTASKRRKDFLDEIKERIHRIRKDNEVIIVSDFNQEIGKDNLQKK